MARHSKSKHACYVVLIVLAFTTAFFAAYADADTISPFKHTHKGWITIINNRRKVRAHHPFGLSSVLNLPRGGTAHHYYDINDTVTKKRRLVIIIDVDNTLYSEQDLLSSTGNGIETQIVRNTHLFGQLHYNLTVEQCNELYREYGSTIEGLRHTLPPDEVEGTMARFYSEVYDSIDFSCLLGVNKNQDGTNVHQLEDDKVRSGYDHGNALLQQRRALAEFLQSLCQRHTVYLASNSPRAHILRVINSMGLGRVDFAGILSPDTASISAPNIIYPTKSSPDQYYKHILDKHPPTLNRIILLDDSLYNLRQAESVGIDGIHINAQSGGRTLEEGLAQAVGHILPSQQYTFNDVEYLHAKNKVDMNAINPLVWEQLSNQLALRMIGQDSSTLRIADLGAGMLSMLELILIGGGEDDCKKPSMLFLIDKSLKSDKSNEKAPHHITKLEYYAYESNLNLLKGSKERLVKMGFQEVKDDRISSKKEEIITFKRGPSDSPNGIEVTVRLNPFDYQSEQSPANGLDLIIGCCFADLFEPSQLAQSLQQFAPGRSNQPLVYFPITFEGMTRFSPAYPSVQTQGSHDPMIPSDTTAFRMYSESLTNHGHNLEPDRIVNAIRDHGGSLISEGSSDWIIDPSSNKHLWETMMYFFGMSGAREMTKYNLDAAGWIEQCRLNPRTIVVSNVDLLFQLRDESLRKDDDASSLGAMTDDDSSSVVSAQEIQFVAPYNVSTITKNWDTSSNYLSPDQVEIESLASLISTGTELKIFKGSFDAASLDVNIKGMADKSMEYPLAYGYSLVGRVVACGSNIDDANSLIGRLVFTFSPHSTRVIVDRDAIQLVPDGITAEDAIFFPSVETALSLVHDANVRVGENVAVYGQG